MPRHSAKGFYMLYIITITTQQKNLEVSTIAHIFFLVTVNLEQTGIFGSKCNLAMFVALLSEIVLIVKFNILQNCMDC